MWENATLSDCTVTEAVLKKYCARDFSYVSIYFSAVLKYNPSPIKISSTIIISEHKKTEYRVNKILILLAKKTTKTQHMVNFPLSRKKIHGV